MYWQAMIKLTEEEWHAIYQRIKQDQPASVLLIRDKCRRVLGFTPRTHKEWRQSNSGRWIPVSTTFLDFYDDGAETMFRLRYM